MSDNSYIVKLGGLNKESTILASNYTNKVDEIQSQIANQIANKIYRLNNGDENPTPINSLSIINIGSDDYYEKVLNNQIQDNALYILSNETEINSFDKRITNVGTPENDKDAVNLSCMNDTLTKKLDFKSQLEKDEILSRFVNQDLDVLDENKTIISCLVFMFNYLKNING